MGSPIGRACSLASTVMREQLPDREGPCKYASVVSGLVRISAQALACAAWTRMKCPESAETAGYRFRCLAALAASTLA